ncbi:hypothetical protein EVG20_g4192 [Dentipellis fragilis]|uniref:Epoxide hydrolase N-terminal domain-containing protein n=1 Tax=Dentipellis fragilis TaxID=205917 RepID=A0A4Y9YYR3_9AGAM|nr:hypothetical protein EVG20_g4192 [Dentipellis fragilis]
MSTEQPFQISVPDDALALLKHKLQQVRFPDELDDAGWDYGVPLADMKRLVSRWADGYDWRAAEAKFNTLPHFTRDIAVKDFGTLNIQYIHQKSKRPNAIPLLFVHGWPGSFIEATKILPLLVDAPDDKPSFHFVAVVLPNFGFSEAVGKRGFAKHQYAEVGHNLMLALGYNEYVIQGGDWGYWICNTIAMNYGPQHAKAWHTNFPMYLFQISLTILPSVLTHSPSRRVSPPADSAALEKTYTQADIARLEHNEIWLKQEQGYFSEQATKPQTIGYALADSPVALLAWIYEKIVTYSDAYEWQDDEVLTWISIYWFSRAGPAASVRIYYEIEHANQFATLPRPTVPLGVSYFPKEVISSPLSWASGMGNVVFQSEHQKGGHLAAYEQPAALVDDLRKMYGRGGPAFGVVPGKTGLGVAVAHRFGTDRLAISRPRRRRRIFMIFSRSAESAPSESLHFRVLKLTSDAPVARISKIDYNSTATPKSAVIHFEKSSAAKTALMLNGGTLDGAHLSVTSDVAHQDEADEEHAKTSPHHIEQSDKPRAGIAAEYLAKGYVLSDTILHRAIQLDNEKGISKRFLNYFQSLDTTLGAKALGPDQTISGKVTQTLQGAAQQAKSVDEQRGFSKTASDFYSRALASTFGQKVRSFYTTTSKQIQDIHEEARRIADENEARGDRGTYRQRARCGICHDLPGEGD